MSDEEASVENDPPEPLTLRTTTLTEDEKDRRGAAEVKLQSKWMKVKAKKPLRERVENEMQIAKAKTATGTLAAPAKPNGERAEYVENFKRPRGVEFFFRVKCDCENCQTSCFRKWDLVHGLKCLMLISGGAPMRRPRRRFIKRGVDFVPPVMTTIPAARKVWNREQEHHGQPPNTIGASDWVAEVVVLYTSLGTSVHRSFHNSIRILNLLRAKGVDHFAVDTNEDVGKNRPDKSLAARWRHLHYLFRDPLKVGTKTKKDVIIPQILIDGIPIGGYAELQTLEDDQDLDYILAREACPNCLVTRTAGCCAVPPEVEENGTRRVSADDYNVQAMRRPTKDYCFNCGAVFREMVDPKMLGDIATASIVEHCFRSDCRGWKSTPSIYTIRDIVVKKKEKNSVVFNL